MVERKRRGNITFVAHTRLRTQTHKNCPWHFKRSHKRACLCKSPHHSMYPMGTTPATNSKRREKNNLGSRVNGPRSPILSHPPSCDVMGVAHIDDFIRIGLTSFIGNTSKDKNSSMSVHTHSVPIVCYTKIATYRPLHHGLAVICTMFHRLSGFKQNIFLTKS